MKNIKPTQTVAVIDVGSNYLRMATADIDNAGNIKILEDVIKPTNIGKDTFSNGRISVETIHKTCDDIKGFSQIMRDYKIKHYKAVSTSGIREASNRQYILQQIRLRTGIQVEIINTSQERFYIMKALRYETSNTDALAAKTTLVVNISTGSVEASIFNDGNLKFTEHVKIGSLRVKEALDELEYSAPDFTKLTEQYIESKLYWAKSNIGEFKIKNFIALGGELSTIIKLIKKAGKTSVSTNFISKDDFDRLYKKIKTMSNDQIVFEYGLSKQKIDLLIPTILIFNNFLKMTESPKIYTPDITLRLGVLYDLSDEIFKFPRKISSTNDILSSIFYICDKYRINKTHATYVEKISLSIFDQTLKIHKLGERERLYLQISSRLHDVGGFIDIANHENQSYNIIICQDIMGFSYRELSIIANITKYHSSMVPDEDDYNYFILNDKDKMIVSILSAIIKMAEALDTSHLQKIEELKLSKSNNTLYFNVASNDDLSLEEWNFNKRANFFEEVLGVKPII
ncbi:MAG: exopolyphosphatase [Clostridium sp.]|jgi:exopolyphosphatase/guanosine-5'-triphosphate,3'-diphosphate pyrophosphatase|uniref:Ppx/GppA phosphatase family protein n=1 Tax=Clostridium sp. TaxID=1506 RepID=UPI0025C278DB|nr:exopolyphosphatase [Clostridium sp.]MCH3965237.1 exopolyphosphatase [Clostridium sp.]MCI1714457.1 exopolyphosphatase [Clostridium sp.]MCI1798719.1 exopolyphosphatase [Clostridium sp.]MCI1812550.1 exopolyphosphatase [Clostridium sp.]MCI1869529.1 exopolyphosphatase [Clostridium sp.]